MLLGDTTAQTVFNHPFIGNILLDCQMRVLSYNELAAKTIQHFFGLSIAEGSSFLRYASTEDQRKRMILNFQQALQGDPVQFEVDLTDSSGNCYRFASMYVPIKNQAGEVHQVLFSAYDVNEMRQQSQLIEQQRQELVKLESIFKALFEHHSHANLLLSPEGQLLAINARSAVLLKKFNLPPLQPKDHFFNAINHSPLESLKPLIQQVIAEKVFIEQEKDLFGDDKKNYWIHLCLVPILYPDGSLLGVFVQMKDINHQKKAEELMQRQQERLRQSEGQLRAMFDNSSDVNILVGADYRIISFNKRAVDIMLEQLQKRLLPGLDIRTFVLSERQTVFEQHFQAALRGQYISLEVEIPNYKGERNWYRFTYTPVIDRLGTTSGVIINAININERKRNEEKILRQNEQIKKFAFLTAHRLRAPVASILGLLNIYDMDGANMSHREVLELMHRIRTATEELNYAISEMNRSLEPFQADSITAQQASDVSVINDTAHPLSVMLIDDDPIVNMVSKTLLQRNYPGIVVHAFLKAEEALQFLKTTKEQPSLILLDIIMPHMNGWQFLQAFEQLPHRPPVFMLSSSLRQSDREEAQKHPTVVDFIAKPIDSEKIKGILKFLKASKQPLP
ncbi:MAG: PAS domain-containing protein [Cytophagales bacterium]|nr:PAS domain-containing protein [Bernardetiaceae bacterium]MDW8204214.1 PAS domain-containing protein [Cytophagales bacterium]